MGQMLELPMIPTLFWLNPGMVLMVAKPADVTDSAVEPVAACPSV